MTKKMNDIKEKSKLSKEEWREYTKTVWSIANTSDEIHPAVFPVEIPTRLIKLFSFWGETVLDPFAGVGTTAEAALALGRRIVCVDQNQDYVSEVKKRFPELSASDKSGQVVHGDSRNLDCLGCDSVGLIVTSPPYWDKADYGKNDGNLGAIGNYQRFLMEMRSVFQECFRVLQPGRKFCLVTAHVNQHTDHGILTFPLATDFTISARDVGFVLVNEIVWSKDGTGGKWGSYGAQRPIFGSYPYPPNFHFKNVHEYILILAKPATKKTTGNTVKPYSQLMSLDNASATNGVSKTRKAKPNVAKTNASPEAPKTKAPIPKKPSKPKKASKR